MGRSGPAAAGLGTEWKFRAQPGLFPRQSRGKWSGSAGVVGPRVRTEKCGFDARFSGPERGSTCTQSPGLTERPPPPTRQTITMGIGEIPLMQTREKEEEKKTGFVFAAKPNNSLRGIPCGMG